MLELLPLPISWLLQCHQDFIHLDFECIIGTMRSAFCPFMKQTRGTLHIVASIKWACNENYTNSQMRVILSKSIVY